MISATPMSNEKLARLKKITKPLDAPKSSALEKSSGSVLSEDIFAPKSADYDTDVTEVSFSQMAVIPLELSIPNPFLLTKTNTWQVALNRKQNFIKDIADGSLILDLSTGELVDSKLTVSSYYVNGKPNYLIGGEALLYLLDKQLDDNTPNNIKERYKRAIIKRYVPKNIVESYPGDPIELLTTDKTDFHLFAEYYLDASKLPVSINGMSSFVFASQGLTISDHSGDLLYNNDKLMYDCGDSTDFASMLYNMLNADSGAMSYSDDDEDDDEDYDEGVSDLEQFAKDIYSDAEVDDSEDDSIGWQDDDSDDDFMEVETNKKDSVEIHQYDELAIFRVITTPEGITRLKNCIMKFLPVLPVGYRKAFEGTVDCKTTIYDRIVIKNLDIAATIDSPNLSADSLAESYKFIYDLVKLLFLGDTSTALRIRIDPRKYKSINDELKSKHGLIRATLEGGRFDYTARTVIVSNPSMRIDCCGVPVEIVGAIFRPFLARKYVESLISAEDISINSIDIPEYINRNYKQYLSWVRKYGKSLNLYAYIGRQPTLHYLSTQPFRVIPVEGHALVLSPLVVVPFNADFDGDQMHIEACLTAAAHEEIMENDLLSQQPKRKPNGSIEAAPRLEMVYGLHMTYFGTEVLTKEVSNYSVEDVLAKLRKCNVVPDGAGSVNRVCLHGLQKSVIGPSDKVAGVTAGLAALTYLLYDIESGIETERMKKDIVKYDSKKKRDVINPKGFTKTICSQFSNYGTQKVAQKLTDVVTLGNGVANRYPPNLNLAVPGELQERIAAEVKDFNERMYAKKDMVNLGLQSIESYDIIYSEEWKVLAKKIDALVAELLPVENGFNLMASTGAKGDSGVLRQLFGVKGVIQQVLDRPFNCVLAHSYSESLNGQDHYCTAYGARRGLTDKVLATSKPGYLSRKLEHAGATQSIVTDDCATTEGIEMTILDINNMLNDSDPTLSWYFWDKESYEAAKSDKRYQTIYRSAKTYLAEKILKRNIVVTEDAFDDVEQYCPGVELPPRTGYAHKTIFVKDITMANQLVNACWGKDFPKTRRASMEGSIKYKPLVMRSPITCKCPVCQTCYGYDPTTDEDAPRLGRQVGFIAAQAISEPGTQMTMKNFQKGGVAGSANLTSSFDVICAYFDMQGRSKTSKILYDYVAPVASVVSERYTTDGSKILVLKTIKDLKQAAECIRRGAYDEIETEGTCLKKVITFPGSIYFKRVVQAGESVILGQKYLDPKQYLVARGCSSVLKYLMLLMTDIYRESGVNSVYVETILSGMVLGKLMEDITVKVDGHDVTYPAGTMVSRSILYQAGITEAENTRIIWVPIGIKQLPKYKPDSMESVIMESMSSYLPKAALLQPVDTCTNPILRVALNQGIYKKG